MTLFRILALVAFLAAALLLAFTVVAVSTGCAVIAGGLAALAVDGVQLPRR